MTGGIDRVNTPAYPYDALPASQVRVTTVTAEKDE
jgi:hypothetical protein